jgi:hypothetical protein
MPTPSFVACIDESGDEGFGSQCTPWFVLAAVVGLQARSPDMHELVRTIKKTTGCAEKTPLHFKKMKCDKREGAIRTLVEDRKLFRAISVLVHKGSITDPAGLREENRLYLYYTRYLLERISWLCRGSKEAREQRYGDGTARVIFSCMNEVSTARLQDYLRNLRATQTEIDWNYIRPDQIESMSAGKHAGLQMADMVAAGFYCCDHPTMTRKTHRWAELLRPVMFRSKRGKYRGYGVKFCPPEIENENAHSALAPWASVYYPE